MTGQIIQPPGWTRPRGYSNGITFPAGGRVLCVAGQIGWNEEQQFESDAFPAQFRQALQNVVAVVEAAGGNASHVAKLTLYVTDKSEYLSGGRAVGQAYRGVMGAWYPAMALVEVSALVEDRAKVEIEAMAFLP